MDKDLHNFPSKVNQKIKSVSFTWHWRDNLVFNLFRRLARVVNGRAHELVDGRRKVITWNDGVTHPHAGYSIYQIIYGLINWVENKIRFNVDTN